MFPLILSFCGLSDGLLVEQMGSRSFAVRERAQRALTAGDPDARLAFARAAQNHPDAEVARRAGVMARTLAERCLERREPFPYLDSLWYDPEAKRYAQWGDDSEGDRLRNDLWPRYLSGRYVAVRSAHDPYAGYRAATRQWVADRIWAGEDPRALDATLAELHRRDAIYRLSLQSR